MCDNTILSIHKFHAVKLVFVQLPENLCQMPVWLREHFAKISGTIPIASGKVLPRSVKVNVHVDLN